jgi:hypothetical protein
MVIQSSTISVEKFINIFDIPSVQRHSQYIHRTTQLSLAYESIPVAIDVLEGLLDSPRISIVIAAQLFLKGQPNSLDNAIKGVCGHSRFASPITICLGASTRTALLIPNQAEEIVIVQTLVIGIIILVQVFQITGLDSSDGR